MFLFILFNHQKSLGFSIATGFWEDTYWKNVGYTEDRKVSLGTVQLEAQGIEARLRLGVDVDWSRVEPQIYRIL